MTKGNEMELLGKRVRHLEKFRNIAITSILIFSTVFGLLGVGAWSILSSKVKDLRANADKIGNKQERIVGQLDDITLETSKKYGEMVTRLDDLRSVASKAKSDAELASNSAGNLAKSISRSRFAAESAEKAAKDTAILAEQARDASEKATAAMTGMQETQKALEVYLSKVTPVQPKNKTFTITISGSFGYFYFVSGDSLPYDRKFSSNSSTATIWVPSGAYALVKVSGNGNHLYVQKDLQGRVSIETSGSFNEQSFLK